MAKGGDNSRAEGGNSSRAEGGDNSRAEGGDSNQAMDAVLLTLGWRGRYQILQFFQQTLCIFPLAFNILSIVFIGKVNEHRCREGDNATSPLLTAEGVNVTYGQCGVTVTNVTGGSTQAPCPSGLQFRDPLDRSIMSEWLLVCESEALTDVSQTLLLVGMMVGAVMFTMLADRYGRKPFHIGCHVGLLVAGLALAFVPSYAWFLLLRFFVGAFQQGTGLTSGILSMEVVPTRYRSVTSVVGTLLWSLSMSLLVLLAFLLQDLSWRTLQLAIASTSVYCFLQIWFTDESLRWLADNGKIAQAEKILRRAAAQNKVQEEEVLAVFRRHVLHERPKSALLVPPLTPASQFSVNNHDTHHLPEVSLINHDLPKFLVSSHETHCPGTLPAALHKSGVEAKELPKYSVLDFFRHKYVFLCALINGFVWLVNAMTYYGLSMTSVTLADNMYLGFLLSALVELPSCLVFVGLIDKFGRKRLCDIFHIMAGVSLLVSVLLPLFVEGGWVRMVVVALSLLGKFAISTTFGIIFLFTPEQFPTNLRNVSLGVASTFGRVGAMVAPFSRTLIRHVSWGPGVIFGTCCLLLPLLMRFVPETSGRELPTTIEEMTTYITTPRSTKRPRPSPRTAHNPPGDDHVHHNA